MKYRVFISYTAENLLEEAQTIKQVAQSIGWEVSDHKDWIVNGKPSVKECYAQVDSCDVVIVLSAARYGWIPSKKQGGDGKSSISWLEVKRAKSRGIPVLPFISKEAEKDSNLNPELVIFQQYLRKNIVGFFDKDIQALSTSAKQALSGFDGKKDDNDKQIRKYERLVVPILFLVGLLFFWLIGTPVLYAFYFEEPMLDIIGWLQTLIGIGGVLLPGIFIILWTIYYTRGRPQWAYRLFPLTLRGEVKLLFCFIGLVAFLSGAFYLSSKPAQQFEVILQSYIYDTRRGQKITMISKERWHNALYEAEIKAFREYVIPILEARGKLSGDLEMVGARSTVRKLQYPDTHLLEERMRLIVHLARFQVLALTQSAGDAIFYFDTQIRPQINSLDVIWQAEAQYAQASWMDYWSFTNTYPSLNRTGVPNYKIEDLLSAYKTADINKSIFGGKPPWVSCASKYSRMNMLFKYCDVKTEGICASFEKELKEAESCYQDRHDTQALTTIQVTKAQYLNVLGKNLEAYELFLNHFDESGDINSGLQALTLQTLEPSIVPTGEGLTFLDLESYINKLNDKKRVREVNSCIKLLKDYSSDVDTQMSQYCRTARACYITDGFSARVHFCGVTDINKTSVSQYYRPHSMIELNTSKGAIAISGALSLHYNADNVISRCDGTVENNATVKVIADEPGMISARVYSSEDSILLVKGTEVGICSDDSPLVGNQTNKPKFDESSAGVRFYANPGQYEFFVGTYNKDKIDFELRILQEDK